MFPVRTASMSTVVFVSSENSELAGWSCCLGDVIAPGIRGRPSSQAAYTVLTSTTALSWTIYNYKTFDLLSLSEPNTAWEKVLPGKLVQGRAATTTTLVARCGKLRRSYVRNMLTVASRVWEWLTWMLMQLFKTENVQGPINNHKSNTLLIFMAVGVTEVTEQIHTGRDDTSYLVRLHKVFTT